MKFTKVLLFLTILLIPLYVVRFEIWGLATTLLEVLIIVTMTVSVSEILWLHRRESFKEIRLLLFQRFKELKLGWLAILFLAAGLTSAVVSADKVGALGIFKAYFLEPVGVYFVIILLLGLKGSYPPPFPLWMPPAMKTIFSNFSFCCKPSQQRNGGVQDDKSIYETLFTPLLLSGLWISLLVIIQKIFHFPNFAPWEMKLGRPSAVFNSANSVGLYLGPILGLTIGKLFDNKNRLIYVILSFLLVIAILFTESSGAIIGALAILIFAVIYAILTNYQFFEKCARAGKLIKFLKYFKYAFFSIFIFHFLLLIFQFFYIDQFAPKVQNPWIRGESTTTIRLCLWQGAKNLILNNPLFGAGLSGFKELYSAYYVSCDAEPLEYPHNLALNFWAETGLLGLVVFFYIIFEVLNSRIEANEARIRANAANSRTNNNMLLGIKLALVYILIHGLVDVPYFKNDLALQFWVIMGIFELLTLTKTKKSAIL